MLALLAFGISLSLLMATCVELVSYDRATHTIKIGR